MENIEYPENQFVNLASIIRGLIGEIDDPEYYLSVESKPLPISAQSFLDSIYQSIDMDKTKIVYCYCAAPHMDESWEGDIFLNFVLEGNHLFGDLNTQDEIKLGKGDIFMVDPMIVHWLTPCFPDQNELFIALQFEINKDDYKKTAKNLINAFDEKENAINNIFGIGDL